MVTILTYWVCSFGTVCEPTNIHTHELHMTLAQCDELNALGDAPMIYELFSLGVAPRHLCVTKGDDL